MAGKDEEMRRRWTITTKTTKDDNDGSTTEIRLTKTEEDYGEGKEHLHT